MSPSKKNRVVDVHEKYYNKWFMSRLSSKKWNKDYKFNLKDRMQEINAVKEYEDLGLHDTLSVSQIVTDEEVMNFIVQLKIV